MLDPEKMCEQLAAVLGSPRREWFSLLALALEHRIESEIEDAGSAIEHDGLLALRTEIVRETWTGACSSEQILDLLRRYHAIPRLEGTEQSDG